MRIQLDKNKFNAALSNRLEDRNKAEQYYKGILTDVTPAKIEGTAKSKYIRENYSLEDRDYFFTEFDNVEIGAQVAVDKKDYLVIEGLRINYCEFKSCQIQNIRFVKCSFVGCTFVKSFFNRVCFESCFFSIPFTEDGMMRPEDIRYAPTVFTDCYFIADFGRFSYGNMLCNVFFRSEGTSRADLFNIKLYRSRFGNYFCEYLFARKSLGLRNGRRRVDFRINAGQ